MTESTLWVVSRFGWSHILRHGPGRHVFENMLRLMPVHVLRHMTDKHLPGHVLRRMMHAVLIT